MSLPLLNSRGLDNLPIALQDPVSYEPMIDAVTILPCGHVLSQKTVETLRSKNSPCPLDRQPIVEFKPNYTVRSAVEELTRQCNIEPTSGDLPQECRGVHPSPPPVPSAATAQPSVRNSPYVATDPQPDHSEQRSHVFQNHRDLSEIVQYARDNHEQQEALFDACTKGEVGKLHRLILNGADVNAKKVYPDGSFQTLLVIVSESGHLDAAKILLASQANVNAKCTQISPFISPFIKKDIPFWDREALSERDNLDKPDYKFHKDWTALHSACFHGYEAIVHELIHNSADVDAKDNQGYTPLALACAKNKNNIVNALLYYKANVNPKYTHNSRPPLSIALYNDNLEMMRRLLASGADVLATCELSASSDAWSFPSSFYGLASSQEKSLRKRIRQIYCRESGIRLAFRTGFSFPSSMWATLPPVMFASMMGQLEAVRLLLEWKADVKAKGIITITFFHNNNKKKIEIGILSAISQFAPPEEKEELTRLLKAHGASACNLM